MRPVRPSEALSTKSAGKEHGTFLITYIDVLYGIMKAMTVIPPRHEQTMASPDSGLQSMMHDVFDRLGRGEKLSCSALLQLVDGALDGALSVQHTPANLWSCHVNYLGFISDYPFIMRCPQLSWR